LGLRFFEQRDTDPRLPNARVIFADRAAFKPAYNAATVASVYMQSGVKVAQTRPVHVFPVHEATLNSGFILPISSDRPP